MNIQSTNHERAAVSTPHSRPSALINRVKVTNADYAFIRDLIYAETRINLGANKRELVAARLGKRLRALGIRSFKEYCQRLQSNSEDGEIYHLIDAISTNHTFFFREFNHFKFLNDTLLPQFDAGKMGDPRSFNVWSCACSTGEEPYSIAISLAERFQRRTGVDWNIQCTDISNRVLHFASKAVYSEVHLKHVDASQRIRYFQKGKGEHAGSFRIRPELRERLSFQRLNLFQNPYPWRAKFQVIFCRNVMIYFDRQTQEELVARLAEHLAPGGYLFIGHAESLAGVSHPYKTIQPAIYQLPG